MSELSGIARMPAVAALDHPLPPGMVVAATVIKPESKTVTVIKPKSKSERRESKTERLQGERAERRQQIVGCLARH